MSLLLIPLLAMCIAVATHVAASRIGIAHRPALGASLGAGVAATAAAVVIMLDRPTGAAAPIIDVIAAPTLLYLSWWYMFLNFVQSLESSLRVRILAELTRAGGSLDEVTLRRRYDDGVLMSLRLARLLRSQAMIERDGRLFVVSPVLALLGRFARRLKRLITGRSSEFA